MICRNIARLVSAVATSIRTERCPRENAHRWRRLSTTFPNCNFGRDSFVCSFSSCRRATPKGGESSVVIWLHAYMTGRVHALMPATHLQMSGRSMGTQSSVPEAAASVSSERSTLPRGLGMAYLTPTCGATCSTCGRRACQVTTPHDDHVCFACEQQSVRQQQKLVESESESCG